MVSIERVFGERIGSIIHESTGKIRSINQKYATPRSNCREEQNSPFSSQAVSHLSRGSCLLTSSGRSFRECVMTQDNNTNNAAIRGDLEILLSDILNVPVLRSGKKIGSPD